MTGLGRARDRAVGILSESRGRRSLPRLNAVLRNTWVLGALVAVLSWNVVFETPAGSLDGSWVLALYMGAEQGLHWGEELIFTCGPLGFLEPLGFTPYFAGYAVAADPNLSALAFVYMAGIHLLLCVTLVWVLRRATPPAIAVVIAFLLVAGFTAIHRPFVLAGAWCLLFLSDAPPSPARRLVVFGGGALAGVESLIRLNSGPTILAMCALALAAGPAPRRDLPSFLATFTAVLTGLWFASGQTIGNFADFIQGGIQIVLGYNEAMANAPPGARWDLAVVAGALGSGALVAGGFVSTVGRRRQVAAAAVMAVAAFSVFKEGVVREDTPHLAIMFATLLALGLVIPWPRAWRLAALAPLAALAAAAVATAPWGRIGDLSPVSHLDSLSSQVRTLISPSRRRQLEDRGRLAMAVGYGLDPATLAALQGRRVHVVPWETGVAWAYALDWRPAPAFQDYTAYTSELDQDNAEFLASPTGPERILRQSTPIDSYGRPVGVDRRLAAWDPPAGTVGLLCGYRALRTTASWQVVERTRDRCGEPRPIASVPSGEGEWVEVPRGRPGEAVLARIQGAGVSGLERVRSLLVRPLLRFLAINRGEASYRLVPGTASDGLLMSIPPGRDFPAPFALSPDARRLRLTGAGGALTYEFFALRVDAARRGGARRDAP